MRKANLQTRVGVIVILLLLQFRAKYYRHRHSSAIYIYARVCIVFMVDRYSFRPRFLRPRSIIATRRRVARERKNARVLPCRIRTARRKGRVGGTRRARYCTTGKSRRKHRCVVCRSVNSPQAHKTKCILVNFTTLQAARDRWRTEQQTNLSVLCSEHSNVGRQKTNRSRAYSVRVLHKTHHTRNVGHTSDEFLRENHTENYSSMGRRERQHAARC